MILEQLAKTLYGGLNLLLPRTCIVCTRALKSGELCLSCTPKRLVLEPSLRCIQCYSHNAPLNPSGVCYQCVLFPPLHRYQRYLWEYGDLTRSFIHTMKYRPSRMLCRRAGKELRDAIWELFPEIDWDLIIPLTASTKALRTRGFNQCALIAKRISSDIKIPLSLFELKHQGYRVRQATLRYDKRIRNVRDVFSVKSSKLKNKRVLLVDDVVTTGATTAAAAVQMLDAGAASVDLLSLTRSEWWETHRARIYAGFRK